MKIYRTCWSSASFKKWILSSGLAAAAFAAPAQQIPAEWAQQLSGRVAQELSKWELDPEVLAAVGIDINQVQQMRTVLMEALQSGSLDALALLRAAAEQALRQAESIPVFQPYAAWLRQRLDYFQVADEVVKCRIPAPSPAPVPPRPPVTEADFNMWYDKIAKRDPPSRAAVLVPSLKPVFRAEGVPEELVWLAEVESSFNPAAESPVGARGLYQFMPATAERFGLSIAPEDDRLDPRKSAEAAAKYLRILHRQFGSWQLALAAYNAGEGRVGRLLETTGGATYEDISGKLPAETRMYVPKIRAVVQLREGVDLRTL